MALTQEQLMIDLENATTTEEVNIISQKLHALESIETQKQLTEEKELAKIRTYTDITRQIHGFDTPLPESKQQQILSMMEGKVPGIVTPDQFIYLHVNITDGDGKEPIGIKNDGTDTLSISATFRVSADPTSAVITSIDNAEWRVTVRNDQKAIYDVVNIKFIAGVCNLSYTTIGVPAFCSILEDDFDIVTMNDVNYKILLAKPVFFKVFRDFSV